MRTKIQSRDLFEGAFLLCQGHHLEGVKVFGNDRNPTVTFLISGENLDQACEDYRYGRATANVTTLKHSLKHLKDVMFGQLRESKE